MICAECGMSITPDTAQAGIAHNIIYHPLADGGILWKPRQHTYHYPCEECGGGLCEYHDQR